MINLSDNGPTTLVLDRAEADYLRAVIACWRGRRLVRAHHSVTGEVHHRAHGVVGIVEGRARESLTRMMIEANLFPLSPVATRWEHQDWPPTDGGWLPGPPRSVQEGRAIAECLAGPAPLAAPPEGWRGFAFDASTAR